MKKNTLLSLALCLGFFSQLSFAQNYYATIHKNVNKRANSLYHDLNTSRDTLILKSDDVINYMYSINRDSKREVNTFINEKNYKLPLTNLSKGKHTFVVEQCAKKIVFVIRVHRDPEVEASLRTKLAASKSH